MSARVKNPIEKSIKDISNEWKQFSCHEEHRLLQWQLNQENSDLVRAFIQLQVTGNGEELDFFVQFKSNFTSPQQYTLSLREELMEQYASMQQVLKQEKQELEDWQTPAIEIPSSEQHILLSHWQSFLDHYGHLFLNWVLVLTPTQIDSINDWQTWLFNTVKVLPKSMKLLILDSDEKPLFKTLLDAENPYIVSSCSKAKMSDAMDKVLQEADDGSESSAYQQHYTKLVRLAANNGDENHASDVAKSAYNIATEKGWFDQQVTVLLTYASLLLNQNKSEHSLSYYTKAIDLCKENLETKPNPAAPKLLVQSLTSKATAYFNHQAYQQAADTYAEAAEVAKLGGDHIMSMENWRMSGYCQQQLQQKQAANDACINALISGEQLAENIRPDTTLPFVGKMMQELGVLPNEVIQQEMMTLVGTDWEQRLQQMTQGESHNA